MDKQISEIRVAARILLLNKNNELLLVSNSQKNIWFTPGGRIEPNETIIEGAKRELFEETGLTVEELKLVYVREAIDGDNIEKPYHHLMLYFVARTEQNLPDSWEDHDGYVDQNKFFSKDEIQNIEKIWPDILKDKFWQDLEEDFKNAEPYSTYKITTK